MSNRMTPMPIPAWWPTGSWGIPTVSGVKGHKHNAQPTHPNTLYCRCSFFTHNFNTSANWKKSNTTYLMVYCAFSLCCAISFFYCKGQRLYQRATACSLIAEELYLLMPLEVELSVVSEGHGWCHWMPGCQIQSGSGHLCTERRSKALQNMARIKQAM